MTSYVDHDIVEKVTNMITFLQLILSNYVHSSFYEDILDKSESINMLPWCWPFKTVVLLQWLDPSPLFQPLSYVGCCYFFVRYSYRMKTLITFLLELLVCCLLAVMTCSSVHPLRALAHSCHVLTWFYCLWLSCSVHISWFIHISEMRSKYILASYISCSPLFIITSLQKY